MVRSPQCRRTSAFGRGCRKALFEVVGRGALCVSERIRKRVLAVFEEVVVVGVGVDMVVG